MTDPTPNGAQGIIERERPSPDLGACADERTRLEIPAVAEVACRFAGAVGHPVLIFQLGAGDPTVDRPDVPITSLTVDQVESAVAEDHFTDPNADFDLIIQSSGGDINAAYRMMSFLRGRVTTDGRLVAWVPRKAQSSATLLCLGADKIKLGELASLGPLDAQIRKGVTDVGTPDYVSALHLLKNLNRLQQFALESFDEASAHLYDHQAAREDLLKYAVKFSTGIVEPLLSRIDSEKVGYWDQMLQTGEYYGCRLLEQGCLIKEPKKTDVDVDRSKHIERVVHHLVFDYPSHELALGMRELTEKLDLDAAPIEAEYRPILREFGPNCADTLIMLVRPATDEDQAAPESAQITRDGWKDIGKDLVGQEMIREVDGRRYWMRVGLYRPPVTPRNPWREFITRAADGGPAVQFGGANLGSQRRGGDETV